MWKNHRLSDHPRPLVRTLRTGVCGIVFVKRDGSLREALGTTDLARIPARSHPKGRGRSIPGIITFYDLVKQEWRCFRRSGLIGWWRESASAKADANEK